MNRIQDLLTGRTTMRTLEKTAGVILAEMQGEKKKDMSAEYDDGWNDAVKALKTIVRRKTGFRL